MTNDTHIVILYFMVAGLGVSNILLLLVAADLKKQLKKLNVKASKQMGLREY